jgi:hypothetical protein
MATIGWTTDTDYDTFLQTRAGFITGDTDWTSDQKNAALTTAYNRLRFSKQLAIPSSPTADELSILQYAQHEYAINFNMLAGNWAEGEKQRLSIIAHGTTEAGLVKEKYDRDKKNQSAIPDEILDILDDFRAKTGSYTGELYRDETDNDTYDANMPGELS